MQRGKKNAPDRRVTSDTCPAGLRIGPHRHRPVVFFVVGVVAAQAEAAGGARAADREGERRR